VKRENMSWYHENNRLKSHNILDKPYYENVYLSIETNS